MDDGIENPINNRNNANEPKNQGVVPLVPKAALYDWAQPTTDNLATATAVPQIQNKGLFSRSHIEDPQQYLKNFLSICVMQRQPNVTPDAIKLLLFRFSIDGILNYRQRPTESLQETWDRFKDMLVKCPYHGIPEQILVQRFYMGLADGLKANVDASAGWMTRASTITPVVHSVALDPNNSIAENMATLMIQMSNLTKKIDESCQKQQVHIVDATNGGLCTPYINQPYVCSWSVEGDNQHYQEYINYVANYGGQRQVSRIGVNRINNIDQHSNSIITTTILELCDHRVKWCLTKGYNQQNQQLAYQHPQQQQIVRQDDGFTKLKGMLDNNNRMLQQLIESSEKMQERVDSHESTIKGIEVQLGQISMDLNNRP
nr:uncharacterized protein LOC104094218 [Nicotiana tomentosiformis]